MLPSYGFLKMEVKKMPGFVTIILTVFMGIMGGLTSIYLLVSIPVLIVWKFYRKIRYGYSLYY